MSERTELTERDRRLLEDIEEIVANGGGEGREADSLYGFCAQLASTVPQAGDAFRQQLEARLVARMQRQEDREGEARTPSWLQRLALGVGCIRQVFQIRGGLTMKKGFALAVIAALVIAVGAVALVPSVRAWGRGVLARFEALIITDAPTWSEVVIDTPPAPTPIGQPTSTPVLGPLPVLTIEEANDVAGFRVLSPEYVPAGYRMVARRVYVEEAGVFVATTCATESGEERVSISQVRYVPGRYEEEFPVGDAPTMDVTVRGQPGLWVEGAKLGIRNDDSGGSELYGVNVLIWEEEDDLFRLSSNELTLEELLKIAESLK